LDRGNYEDAVRLRQQIANLFTVFFTRTGDPDDQSPVGDLISNPDSPLIGLQPGITMELDPGQDVKFANPPEAGTMYSEYIRTELMGEASAQGLPYEIHSGDIRNVSDRTLRVAINEFRRFAQQRQWQVVIPQMCQRVREWFVDSAVLSGLIYMKESDDAKRVEWAPHGWEYIHPVQDVQGKKLEIETGITSRSAVVGERGDDIEEVDAETAADDKRQQTLKIGPYSKSQQQINNPPAPAPAPAPAPEPAPAPAPKKTTAHLIAEDQMSLFEQQELLMIERTLENLGVAR
jgi:capsid protein